ncbi:MAG: PEP-CTERM sorting domain-containing protein [Opitutales bacterium]
MVACALSVVTHDAYMVNLSIGNIAQQSGLQKTPMTITNDDSGSEYTSLEITGGADTVWNHIVNQGFYGNNFATFLGDFNQDFEVGAGEVSSGWDASTTNSGLEEVTTTGTFNIDPFTSHPDENEMNGTYTHSLLDTHDAAGNIYQPGDIPDGLTDWDLYKFSALTPQQQTIAGANNWDFTPSVTAYAGTFSFSDQAESLSYFPTNANIPTAVPEPGLAGLLAGSLIGCWAWRRRWCGGLARAA